MILETTKLKGLSRTRNYSARNGERKKRWRRREACKRNGYLKTKKNRREEDEQEEKLREAVVFKQRSEVKPNVNLGPVK